MGTPVATQLPQPTPAEVRFRCGDFHELAAFGDDFKIFVGLEELPPQEEEDFILDGQYAVEARARRMRPSAF